MITCFPKIGSFLHQIVKSPLILEEFYRKLQNLDKDNLPILLFRHPISLRTPFDNAIILSQINSINILINMLISFQNNPCFNYIVDHNLCTLIEKQISLKDYFENS